MEYKFSTILPYSAIAFYAKLHVARAEEDQPTNLFLPVCLHTYSGKPLEQREWSPGYIIGSSYLTAAFVFSYLQPGDAAAFISNCEVSLSHLCVPEL